jgi:outer membrane beta-barrel protein
VVVFALSTRAVAQSLPGSELPTTSASSPTNNEEDIYDREDSKPTPTPAPVNRKAPPPEAQNLSDLAKLAPFSDIAVIQRRFLPKTDRFEFSASGFTNLNNPFFSAYGLGLEVDYYLREQYAIGAIAQANTTASRQATDDLEKKQKISTSNLVTSKGFEGLIFKWNPIYGKMTLLNKTIVPFDLNFSVGAGMTQTTAGHSEITYRLGTSQVFAYSKSMAFRWDFGINQYNATALDDDNRTVKLSQWDLFLGVGVSFYFPEATYR